MLAILSLRVDATRIPRTVTAVDPAGGRAVGLRLMASKCMTEGAFASQEELFFCPWPLMKNQWRCHLSCFPLCNTIRHPVGPDPIDCTSYRKKWRPRSHASKRHRRILPVSAGPQPCRNLPNVDQMPPNPHPTIEATPSAANVSPDSIERKPPAFDALHQSAVGPSPPRSQGIRPATKLAETPAPHFGSLSGESVGPKIHKTRAGRRSVCAPGQAGSPRSTS